MKVKEVKRDIIMATRIELGRQEELLRFTIFGILVNTTNFFHTKVQKKKYLTF